MSFFDDADEPRTAQRSVPRRTRPPSGGRRPPGDQQSIQVRRAVAAIAIIVVLILIILGIHSCQISARNSALKDYNNSVSSLIQQSDQTSTQLFRELSTGGGSSNATALQQEIDQTRVSADRQLAAVKKLNVPDEDRGAQQNLLLAFQMRSDGIRNIASDIQPALGTTTSKDAVSKIASEMALFYASDAVYKAYVAPLIAGAFKSAGITIGGTGENIAAGQFLPNLDWLNADFVATKLNVSLPTPGGGSKPSPGLHGHALNSVSVAGTTLQTGSTNTIAATPAPTFTLTFTNGGQHNERNVVLKVTVTGTSVSGQTTIPETTAGQQTTGKVTLSSSPPTGQFTVVATIEKVPGENNTSNNTLSFPVTFQ